MTNGGLLRTGQTGGGGGQQHKRNNHGGRAIRDDFHASIVSAERGTQVPTGAVEGGRGTKGARQGMTKKCRREGIYGVMVTPSKARHAGLVTRDETPFRN